MYFTARLFYVALGADYSVVQKTKRKKKTRKRSHTMSPPHTPPPLPPPLRAKMVEECMVGEKKDVCPVDNNIMEFKICEKGRMETSTKVNTDMSMEVNAEMNTASALSEAVKEEPIDLGLTCVRCGKPLASSRTGKHHRHAMKPSGVKLSGPCPEAGGAFLWSLYTCTYL